MGRAALRAPRPGPVLPDARSLGALRKAAARCTGCPLYRNATQTVFGAGPARAHVMLVGEQPGDEEDRTGKPFVGPAGRELDRGLARARIDRSALYLTNAVKHFKWEPRGKKRIHQKPTAREVAACRLWLEAEIEALKPTAIVCLGATAAQALLGRGVRVTRVRGERIDSPLAPVVMATVHPSAILRARTAADRARERAAFQADLVRLAGYLARAPRDRKLYKRKREPRIARASRR
jgi:uracil-DNA glycosylase family protein